MASPDASDADLGTLGKDRAVAGWVALLVPGAIAALTAFYGYRSRDPLLLRVALFHVLAVGALVVTRRALTWRRRSLLAEMRGDEPTARTSRPSKGLMWVRWTPYLLTGLVALVLLMDLWAPWLEGVWPEGAAWLPTGDARPLGASVTTTLGWIVAAGAAAAALMGHYYGSLSAGRLPEARGLGAWLRAGFWVSTLTAVALLRHDAWGETFHAVLLAILHVLLVGVAVEFVVRAVVQRSSWRLRANPDLVGLPVTTPLVLQLVASRFNPLSSLFAVLADGFGIDLRGTWALSYIRRSLLPLGVALVVLGWLSTSIVTVPLTSVGLLERYGDLVSDEPLEPGMHFQLPWPLDVVHRVPVHRVETIPLGYEGGDASASMLWTKTHATEEYNLLVGDGRDLLTVNATLHYRIADPVSYVYATQNPDEALAILADRVLMRETVGRSLDDTLSENVGALTELIQARIQASADRWELGLEVVDLTLMGLHPPIDVAADYQAVVAAQIEAETAQIEARTYRAEALPAADADARGLVADAQTAQVERLSDARGASIAFEAADEADRTDSMYRFRKFLETQEQILAGRSFTIIDDGFEKDGGAVWILDT